jgi:hypothetical protein
MVTRTVEVDGEDSNPDCGRRTSEDQGWVVAVVGCRVEVERKRMDVDDVRGLYIIKERSGNSVRTF